MICKFCRQPITESAMKVRKWSLTPGKEDKPQHLTFCNTECLQSCIDSLTTDFLIDVINNKKR